MKNATKPSEPLISVVVAIYNSEKFLDRLINSITKQTYRNLDIILVDDGSPDGSGAICDKWAAGDNRIRVLHKENGGTCDARNKGIELARGDYLVIIDGDDWLADDYVEYLLKLIQRPGVNMAMTDSVFTTRDMIQNPTDEIRDLTPEEAVSYILYPKIPIGPWNKMYAISSIKEHNLTFSTKWSGEGLYYTTMAAQWSTGVALGHRRIYYYRLNNSQSGLTHYNVQMGLNACENIRLIRDSLIIRTPKTLNAANWHIWKNYGYLLFLIVATGQEEKYAKEYRDCIRNMRRRLPSVILKSELGPRAKLGMLRRGLFPVHTAKKELEHEREERAKDHMV